VAFFSEKWGWMESDLRLLSLFIAYKNLLLFTQI
jgi:hypothetical protein